jgi:KUP system potassium uptake protein
VLLGLDPRYAISYLAHDGFKGFAVLGGVFLCVTGAEALSSLRECDRDGRGALLMQMFLLFLPALSIAGRLCRDNRKRLTE